MKTAKEYLHEGGKDKTTNVMKKYAEDCVREALCRITRDQYDRATSKEIEELSQIAFREYSKDLIK